MASNAENVSIWWRNHDELMVKETMTERGFVDSIVLADYIALLGAKFWCSIHMESSISISKL